MDKLPRYDDLEKHFNASSVIIDSYKNAVQSVQVLRDANRVLSQQFERTTKAEKSVKQQYNDLVNKSVSEKSLNMLYVQLKEKYRTLENKHVAETFKLNDQKCELESKLRTVEIELKRKIDEFDRQVKDLHDGRQVDQTRHSFEMDEVRSSYYAQQEEASKKLQEERSANNFLRGELVTVKTNANMQTTDLRNKLFMSQQNERQMQCQLDELTARLEAVNRFEFQAKEPQEPVTTKKHQSTKKSNKKALNASTSYPALETVKQEQHVSLIQGHANVESPKSVFNCENLANQNTGPSDANTSKEVEEKSSKQKENKGVDSSGRKKRRLYTHNYLGY